MIAYWCQRAFVGWWVEEMMVGRGSVWVSSGARWWRPTEMSALRLQCVRYAEADPLTGEDGRG